jgi:hypothetical protein
VLRAARICMHECRGLDSRSHALPGYLRFRDVFGVTRVATEKSDFRHSTLVLLHSGGSRWYVGSSPSHHARDSEVYQSQQKRAYGPSRDDTRPRHRVIAPSVALPNIPSF